jgi:DNA helicase-2/ATP-dependent DNA helicase PcrA
MHVRHPTFGEGIVMESRVDSDDEEVIVAFGDDGIKHLLASLAPLEINQDADA